MRRGFLIAGLATLIATWLGPLPRLAQTSFSAHMIMHMSVVAVVSPLLALGLRGFARKASVLNRFSVFWVSLWLSLLRIIEPLRYREHREEHFAGKAGLGQTRIDPVLFAPALFTPLVASMLELVVVWAWHAPVLHQLARQSALGLFLEQSSFLFCGLLLWVSAFGGDGPEQNSRRGAGVIALLLTSMHMTLLGALLALAPRPLYHHSNEMHNAALADQHLGGAVMLLVGGVSYLAGGLALAFGLLRGFGLKTDRARL